MTVHCVRSRVLRSVWITRGELSFALPRAAQRGRSAVHETPIYRCFDKWREGARDAAKTFHLKIVNFVLDIAYVVRLLFPMPIFTLSLLVNVFSQN